MIPCIYIYIYIYIYVPHFIATPASFSAHVVDRNMEDQIALQQLGNYTLGRNVDLMFGGGSCHFKPRSAASGSCRLDTADPLALIKEYGWNFMESKTDFEALNSDVVR